MLKAQRDRGNPGHRIIAIDEKLEVYIAVLHRLVDKVGPLFVAYARKTEADRPDFDGGIELIGQEYGIEETDGGAE